MKRLKEAKPPASQRVCALQGNITSSILQIGKLGVHIASILPRAAGEAGGRAPHKFLTFLATVSMF